MARRWISCVASRQISFRNRHRRSACWGRCRTSHATAPASLQRLRRRSRDAVVFLQRPPAKPWLVMNLILIVLLVALLIPLAAVILDSQVGRALAARLEGRDVDSPSERRLAALEGEIDRLSRELQRLDEESAFIHRLLEEKRPQDRSLPPGDNEH